MTVKFDIIKPRVNEPVQSLKAKWIYQEMKLPYWQKIEQIKVDLNEWNVYSVTVNDISDWIESQPHNMWKDYNGSRLRYRLSPELEVWFLLRWS